ncbi:hypothetical protein COU60_01230 [Candidatus Pacearchaeota archaeon CG10_big_fil_rev_8_21_14_0_10_34_76]|nr:MAG: hypothetical protein COU60_01230 [Candidatus Pacearchaeota archaeon CG10_big_fil_rev_8_21_14_0_10_34_76]
MGKVLGGLFFLFFGVFYFILHGGIILLHSHFKGEFSIFFIFKIITISLGFFVLGGILLFKKKENGFFKWGFRGIVIVAILEILVDIFSSLGGVPLSLSASYWIPDFVYMVGAVAIIIGLFKKDELLDPRINLQGYQKP